MQIHELNNFSGTLGSGAYLAIDDGNDTGKISSQGLLAATEARIDNIIAGPAPSAEEIVDARLGDDGVTYPSLGDAIRDQFSDVKSALNQGLDSVDIILKDVITSHFSANKFDKDSTYNRSGYAITTAIKIVALSGSTVTHPIYVESGHTYGFMIKPNWYGANGYVVGKTDRFGNLKGTAYTATNGGDGYGYFTADETGYVVVNCVNTSINSFMFFEGNTAPSDYIAFSEVYDKALSIHKAFINGSNTVNVPYNDADSLPNCEIVLYANVNSGSSVANLPVYPFNGYIIPIRNEPAVGNFTTQFAVLITADAQEVYIRNRFANWSEWLKLPTSKEAVTLRKTFVNASSTVSAPYNDIDNIPNGQIVLYSNVSNDTSVANLPTYPFNGYIIPIRNEQAVGNFSTQIAVLISQTSQEMYFRNRFATWSEWSKLATSDSGSFNQNDNDAYMGLKNFTAVGDSITVGYSTPALNEYYIVRGWAEMLSHKIGVTFDKFATGGYGTADTIGASYYSTAIANSNNNEFAFLNLGINDLNHSLTIGTADSIGANDGTFIGNYSKIVSDLLTNHNFVLCGTIPQCLDDKVAREDYNDAIELVANYYSKAFVIDVAKWNDLFAPYALLGHLSSVGYGALTKAFILSINETMNNNSYFQTTIDRDNA